MERVRCFFDVEVDAVPLGRIIFELFNDACPKTCENFRALCTGELGEGKTTGKPLHYRNVKFHRVIKDFMVQAGDFSAGNGTGGESIYGGHFEDENFDLKHDTPFLLSMANRGKDTNGSQFFITTQTASHLDGKHVVFGRVINGQEVVVAVENLSVDNRSRPLQQPLISNCGELILQRSGKLKPKDKKKKKKAKEDNLTDSEEEKKKTKKKKKEKKNKKEKLSEGEIDENDENQEIEVEPEIFRPHPFAIVSTINPDDIPEVPKNRFLDRGYQNRLTNADGPVNQQGRMRSRGASNQHFTRSGRKIKGRGSLRYRTPSHSRSRSTTPPHWKQAQRRTVTYEKYQRQTEIQQDHDREIEDRRKLREERHRLMGMKEVDEDNEEEDDDDHHKKHRDVMSGVEANKKKFRSKDGFPAQMMQDDKTNRDWRVARQETTLENKENKTRSNGRDGEGSSQDLRQKLKDRFGKKSSVRDFGEMKMDDDEEMDENVLDFEASSDSDGDNDVVSSMVEVPIKRNRPDDRKQEDNGGRRYENNDRKYINNDRRRGDEDHRRRMEGRRDTGNQRPSRRIEMAHYRPPHRTERPATMRGDDNRNPKRSEKRASRSHSRNRSRRERSADNRRDRKSPEKRSRRNRSSSSESD